MDLVPALELQPNDTLLLCSDGLWDMVYPEDRLAGFLAKGEESWATCRQLVQAANEAGGEDNITVLLVRLEGQDG